MRRRPAVVDIHSVVGRVTTESDAPRKRLETTRQPSLWRLCKQPLPNSTVVPVWATECEQHDGAETGLCAGVGCFKGICWKAFSEQLRPLEEQVDTLAVLLPFRELQRDLPIYGESAGWIKQAVKLFQVMPPKHGGRPVQASRLVAVLQGWDVSPAEIQQQIRMASEAGTSGYVVAFSKIEQGWEPRLAKWR